MDVHPLGAGFDPQTYEGQVMELGKFELFAGLRVRFWADENRPTFALGG